MTFDVNQVMLRWPFVCHDVSQVLWREPAPLWSLRHGAIVRCNEMETPLFQLFCTMVVCQVEQLDDINPGPFDRLRYCNIDYASDLQLTQRDQPWKSEAAGINHDANRDQMTLVYVIRRNSDVRERSVVTIQKLENNGAYGCRKLF